MLNYQRVCDICDISPPANILHSDLFCVATVLHAIHVSYVHPCHNISIPDFFWGPGALGIPASPFYGEEQPGQWLGYLKTTPQGLGWFVMVYIYKVLARSGIPG
jgi:hypothetical protein